MCSCCNATYFGQPQIYFRVRAFEHLWIAHLTGKFVKTPKKYAIFCQMLCENDTSNFNNFSILLKEKQQIQITTKGIFINTA